MTSTKVRTELEARGIQVASVSKSISNITQGVQVAPDVLNHLMEPLTDRDKEEIKEEFGLDADFNWQCFFTEKGRLVTYERDQFYKFLKTLPPEGLGTTPERLKRVADMLDDKKVKGWIIASEGTELKSHGGDRKNKDQGGGPTLKVRRGSETNDYVLKRLERDHKDLFQQVLKGDLTISQAGKKVGLIRDRVKVNKKPDSFIKAIHRHFTPEQIKYIKENL